MNNAAVNICVQACDHMFSIILGLYLGVELLDNMVALFNFVRDCQTVFPKWLYLFYSHLQCMKIPTSLHPCQHVICCC